MKKINILITILLSTLFIGGVKAADARISISPDSKTILVGNTITVTVTTSSSTSVIQLVMIQVCYR